MSGRSVYIGGLPDEIKQDDLRKILTIYGKIITIYIYPGYGFVEFESEDDAKDAVASLKGQPFLGYDMTIQLAKHRRNTMDDADKGDTKAERSPARAHSRTSNSHNPERQPKTRYPVTVYNLEKQTCWQELKDFGRGAGGTVVFCQVDKINRGRGLIEYVSQEDADRAVKELNGRELRGKALALYTHPHHRPYDQYKRVSPAPKSPVQRDRQRHHPYPQPRSRQSTAESSYSHSRNVSGTSNNCGVNLSPVRRVEIHSPHRARQSAHYPREATRASHDDPFCDTRIHTPSRRYDDWEWDRRADEYSREWERYYG